MNIPPRSLAEDRSNYSPSLATSWRDEVQLHSTDPTLGLGDVDDRSHGASRPMSPSSPASPMTTGSAKSKALSAAPTPAPAPAEPKAPRGFCPSGATTSLGSTAHGELVEGQPKCQPCAWFYKETGCLNGGGCRYCHLCPYGELKNRKKQKIQRLRAQEAEQAAAEAAAAAEAEAEAAQAGGGDFEDGGSGSSDREASKEGLDAAALSGEDPMGLASEQAPPFVNPDCFDYRPQAFCA